MVATRNKPATKATLRRARFARLLVEGMEQVEAWLLVYAAGKNRRGNRKTATQQASRLANSPAVKAEIAQLKSRAEVKTVLSLNERLAIMARGAQADDATWGERARCVEVYNKTAGDHAPERQEVTVKGDAGSPVVVTSRPMTKAEKVAALIAQRRTASDAPPSPA